MRLEKKKVGGRGWMIPVVALAALATVQPVRAQAPENVRLVFQLVEANGFQEQAPEIADVVSELRELFRFRGYRLAATGLLNVIPDGFAGTRLTGGPQGGYQVEVNVDPVWVEAEGDNPRRSSDRVRIQVSLHHETQGPAMEVTVNVRDGQTLVLGSTRTVEGEALILIMRTELR